MQFRLFIGIPHTLTMLIQEHLNANAQMLDAEGIAVRLRRRQRKALRLAAAKFSQTNDQDEIFQELKANLSLGEHIHTIVGVDDSITGEINAPLGGSHFFPTVRKRFELYLKLFGEENITALLALEDLGQYIPDIYALNLRAGNVIAFEDFIKGPALPEIDLIDFIYRCKLRNDAVPLHLFSIDEYPFIWRDVLHALTGCYNHQALIGETPQAFTPYSLGDAQAFYQHLNDNPEQNSADNTGVWDEFFKDRSRQKETVNHPEWPLSLQSELAEIFEFQLDEAQSLPNVNIIRRNLY